MGHPPSSALYNFRSKDQLDHPVDLTRDDVKNVKFGRPFSKEYIERKGIFLIWEPFLQYWGALSTKMPPTNFGGRLVHIKELSVFRGSEIEGSGGLSLEGELSASEVLRSADLWVRKCVKSRAFLLCRCPSFPSPSCASHALPYP